VSSREEFLSSGAVDDDGRNKEQLTGESRRGEVRRTLTSGSRSVSHPMAISFFKSTTLHLQDRVRLSQKPTSSFGND